VRGRASGEGVEQDRECEGEQALGDPDREAGQGLGEVPLESHLALEIGEDALDCEPDGGESPLAGFVAGGPLFAGVISSTPAAARRLR
jgi:hypothetical protein